MQAQRVTLTYQDYCELPDDGRQYEIHEGELIVTPAPGRRHQRSIGRLHVMLFNFVETRKIGELYIAPFDVILDDSTIVQPDLVFVENSRLSALAERGMEGAPTLAVEIISPYTGRIDRVRKLQLYAKFQIPFYWLLDPIEHTLEGYRLVDDGYALVGRYTDGDSCQLPPFEDLSIVVSSLWD